MESQRVGLEKHRAFGVANLVLVQLTQAQIRHEQLPHPGLVPFQRMAATVPFIEGADHTDPAGVGRPDREVDAHHAFLHPQVRAQFGEQVFQCSRLQRLAVGVGERGFVNGVGVVEGGGLTGGVDGEEPVLQHRDSRNPGHEQSIWMYALHFPPDGAVRRQHVGSLGPRQKGADRQHSFPFDVMRSQDRIGSFMTQLNDLLDVFFQHSPRLFGCPALPINITNLRF